MGNETGGRQITGYDINGAVYGTPTQLTYSGQQPYRTKQEIPSIYSNYAQELDIDPSTPGIQAEAGNLTNKKWLENTINKFMITNSNFSEDQAKIFRDQLYGYGKTLNEYNKYFDKSGNPISGINLKKAREAKRRFEAAQNTLGQTVQGMKQVRYGVDENGNTIKYYEGDKGFGEEGKNYNTAEEATAAYQKQQQYNKDARSWAGKNYMEDSEYWDGQNVYDQNLGQTHEDVINKLANIAGITDSDLINKAKSKHIWGANSDAIFKKAVDTLAAKDYQKAVRLYNQVKGMYGSDKPLQFAKNFTLYDGSNAFTSANKRNWLESEAGVNDVTDYYDSKGKKGYEDDYQEYRKKQDEKAAWQKNNGGFGAYYGTQFKQGGKMNKYQQGGQAPTAAQMVLQALSAAQQGDQSGLQQLFSDKKTAQAVIQQLQKEAQEGSEEAIQALEALKQIMSGSKKQATMAQKGAKLSYIHRLATGCPPGMEMTYFKKGGRLCKACIEKAKKAKEGASLDNIIAKNKERYPGITNDQAAGRAPIRKNGKDYYLGGDGVLSEAPKRSKYGFGGFFEYFKCGGKPKKPKCGTKAKCGAELEKCGGKTPMDKCGGKTPMTKCGGKAPMDKCGGKTTLAKCGTELKKCGGKAKKSSPKKPIVNKDKCGGKAKKHAIGGNLELLKYMILNYNK